MAEINVTQSSQPLGLTHDKVHRFLLSRRENGSLDERPNGYFLICYRSAMFKRRSDLQKVGGREGTRKVLKGRVSIRLHWLICITHSRLEKRGSKQITLALRVLCSKCPVLPSRGPQCHRHSSRVSTSTKPPLNQDFSRTLFTNVHSY